GEPLEDLAAEPLEGAAGVADVVPRDEVADPVPDPRLEAPPSRVGPGLPDPGDGVGALERPEEAGDVARSVLAVRVGRHDEPPPRGRDPRREGGRLSPVLAEPEDAHRRESSPQALQDLEGTVAAAVVDEEHLGPRADRAERFLQLGGEGGEALLLVED